jgi:hypothetical protein
LIAECGEDRVARDRIMWLCRYCRHILIERGWEGGESREQIPRGRESPARFTPPAMSVAYRHSTDITNKTPHSLKNPRIDDAVD